MQFLIDMKEKNKPTSILLIYTGGTIGMIQSQETGLLEPFDFQYLSQFIPDLNALDCTISTIQFENPLDSSEIGPDVWIKIAQIITENYAIYDGFVVLHGTDTMAFTASALSFILENLSKPVILTGSQLPLGMLRTDGKENFQSFLLCHLGVGEAQLPDIIDYINTIHDKFSIDFIPV